MKILNYILGTLTMIFLFATGLGWFFGRIGFWEKNTKFQVWLNNCFPIEE